MLEYSDVYYSGCPQKYLIHFLSQNKVCKDLEKFLYFQELFYTTQSNFHVFKNGKFHRQQEQKKFYDMSGVFSIFCFGKGGLCYVVQQN